MNRMTDLGKVWKKVKGTDNSTLKAHAFSNLFTQDKTLVTDTEQKANIIANAFQLIETGDKGKEVGRKREVLEKDILSKVDLHAHDDSYSPLNDEFNMRELKDAMKETKNTSAGKDGIKAITIQSLPAIMFRCLLEFYNEVWIKACFPLEWYQCVQIPVLKPGKDPTNPNSYRPITLTSVLCKIMERMVKNRLVWYLERNSLLTPFQAGFRKNRSTIDQLVRLETDIHKGMMNKEYTVVVFLDLEKAFDKIWREGIAYKCGAIGIKDRMLRWIISFLGNRHCVVKMNGLYSAEYILKKGTPQGSVISPILFNIMMSDLNVKETSVKLSVYADDIALWSTGRNLSYLQRKVQRAIEDILAWCKDWNVNVSADKSAVMVFTNKQKHEKIIIILLLLLNQATH